MNLVDVNPFDELVMLINNKIPTCKRLVLKRNS